MKRIGLLCYGICIAAISFGQHRFKEMVVTLVYASGPDDTLEKTRDGQVRTLKMGLMRYVIKTPLAQHMEIRFTEPLQEEVSTDRWKNWVFSTSLNGYLSGQKIYNSFDFYGSFSASKVGIDRNLNRLEQLST